MSKNFSKKRKKILVSLSGGVDSSVAAALLKKQGYDVVGAHFWFFGSAWKLSFQAEKIAKKLGIPLKIVDARKEFKKRVIDYFIDSYKKGLTPNPCVVCNKEMKFRLLLDLMRKYKFDYVATGHYVRVVHVTRNTKHITKNMLHVARCTLREARDKTKDQSYFLYRLAQKDLAKIVFPLGEYKKEEVKKIAKKLGLPAGAKESQDICFLRGSSLKKFLAKRIEREIGEIRETGGNILGRHKGLPFCTIGQRKGIEIGGTGPYFVVGKNVRKNELIVANNPKKLLTNKFFVSKVNWINKVNLGNTGNRREKYTLQAQVQVRYHSPKISAKITSERPGRLAVETKKKLQAVTPGQSAVFYKNGEILGGGVIFNANSREY